jgi:hypothetical protein
LKQQACFWCWEEVATLMRDGDAYCEDCYHESITWMAGVDRLTQDLTQTLEPILKRWVQKHLTAGVEAEQLEAVFYDYGITLTNARAFLNGTSE